MIPTASVASPLADEDLSPTSQEIPIEENLILFSDGLKDLRNLKSQLHSAAEYFEFSYMHEDQKQPVIDNVRDYVLKALINAVDHLGSMSFKVNNLIEDKVMVISEMDARLSCTEQRIKTSQDQLAHKVLQEQAFPVPKTPRFHKRYLLPMEVGECSMAEWERKATPNDGGLHVRVMNPESMLHQDVVLLTAREKQPSFELAPSPKPSSSPSIYSPTLSIDFRRILPPAEAREGSSLVPPPAGNLKRHLHGGSAAAAKPPLRSAPSIARRFVVEIQKSPKILKTSTSLRPPLEEGQKETDHVSSKGKHFLKSLLSKRKYSKKYDISSATAHAEEDD